MIRKSRPFCPSCGSSKPSLIGPIPGSNAFAGRHLDRILPGGSLWKCSNCYLHFRFPILAKDDADELYRQGSSESWAEPLSQRVDWQIVKKVISATPDIKSIIDVGCYDGRLLDQFGSEYIKVGIEVHQDAANIAVYLPRSLSTVQFAGFAGTIFFGLGALMWMGGEKVQEVVDEKSDVSDVRSATIINLIYGIILYIFKVQSKVPMSTTWVFVGLLAGREIALAVRQASGEDRSVRAALRMAARDLIYVSIGFIVAVIIAVAKFVTLTLTGMKVSSQAKNAGSPDGGNPLGRIINVYRENEGVDSETLQLKIDEAILKEQPSINRFIGFIKIISMVAPLLGLLGTVIGMIVTFQAITLFGTGDPKTMAGGISQALITTVLGLVVAIPTVLLHYFVNSRAQGIMQILNEQSGGLIAEHAENAGK